MLKRLPFKSIPKKFILMIIILIGGGYFFLGNNSQTKGQRMEFATAQKANISSTISASGTLGGKDSVNLKFRMAGKMTWLNIKEGDQVTAGQAIAGLDTTDLSIALQQAQNTLTAAQATAQKIEDEVKGHDKDENFTQKETRVKAQAASNNAYDAVKAAQRDFQDAVIISPINGIITQADFLPGQNITAADLIAQVVDISETYFEAEVDEADAGKVIAGQKAEVSLNAYPDQIFAGKVESIKPMTKTTSSNATVITVRISLDNPPSFISGLNGQASIITQEVNNTLSIPLEALGQDNTVFVQASEGLKPVKVTAGISSDSSVEIKEGLNEGDKVLLNPPSDLNIRRASGQFSPVFRFFRPGR